jgi:uncharacterized protein with GYD domain
MDTYIVLLKYTSAGRRFAGPEYARRRWELIETSLKQTLKGEVLSSFVSMGEYDAVVTFSIPPHQDFHLFQCLQTLQEPGDVELTVLRAWTFEEFAGKAKQGEGSTSKAP